MNITKRFQLQQGLFLDQNDLRWLVGGIFFHMGLISAFMPLFVLGIYGFPARVSSYSRAIKLLTCSSFVCVVLQGPSYYQAVAQEHAYPIFFTSIMGGLWCAYWLPWSTVYIGLRKVDRYHLPTIWIMLSAYIFEYLGVGFSHVGPMLVGTFWENSIYWFGEGSIFLFIWLTHLLKKPLLKHGLWFVPLLLNSTIGIMDFSPLPGWLDKIDILPEGVEAYYGKKEDLIYGKRIHKGSHIYYASIGGGQVQGISIKRHFVKIVESGYSSYLHTRMINFQGHNFLLLVCNDALFSDLGDEILDAEAVVVTSWLTGLQGSPLKHYFLKRLEYIHLKYGKPLMLVDAEEKISFPKDYSS